MKLCINCLERFSNDVQPTDIGPDQGGQRDPWRKKLDLCSTCRDALIDGQMDVVHERYAVERKITRN